MSEFSSLTPISQTIVRTLLYYDIFNYPLKPNEIFRFLGAGNIAEEEMNHALCLLCNEGLIFQFGDFFSIQNNERNVLRRIKGNVEAKRYLELAKQKAKLIMQFPFVRAVMASGSLSKEFMDENSDIDFFIATKPGRLWIARTLLVLYKRIFLLNSHKYFCVNYFVDTDHLAIEEKNLFTATELATVIPLYGAEYYQELLRSNAWLLEFFPNYQPRSIDGTPYSVAGSLKKFLEVFFNLLFGNQVNKFFMNLTLKRWRRLYQKDYPSTDFQVAFKTKHYASKNHPNHYQRKVIALLEDKWTEFLNRMPVNYHGAQASATPEFK